MTVNPDINVMAQIVDLLTPLTPEDRKRIIRASLALLGDGTEIDSVKPSRDEPDSDNELPPRARNWLKQNILTSESLEEVFHFSGGVSEIIASDIPGKSDKEKTYNAYILSGISKLLSTGDAKFEDKDARELCKRFGCLNEANHSAYMKNKGNELSGSKEKGWTLTSPGLKQGAVLIQALNKK